jgi:hypothetical protein
MYTIRIFTNITRNGNKKGVFTFVVNTLEQVMDHVKNINRAGYFRTVTDDKFEWYPPQSILKVEAEGTGVALSAYSDSDDTNQF